MGVPAPSEVVVVRRETADAFIDVIIHGIIVSVMVQVGMQVGIHGEGDEGEVVIRAGARKT